MVTKAPLVQGSDTMPVDSSTKDDNKKEKMGCLIEKEAAHFAYTKLCIIDYLTGYCFVFCEGNV